MTCLKMLIALTAGFAISLILPIFVDVPDKKLSFSSWMFIGWFNWVAAFSAGYFVRLIYKK